MFHCHVCGSNSAQQKKVSEVFVLQRRRILVEDIPASVCLRCGEATFSRQTTEKVRRMVHRATELGLLNVPAKIFV
ncbi:MAG: YgiT-type zinc finger protein [Gemmatimonadetes bacterium]|nr:YgiT-type zinc finger protein [Gemmatimonadota bacterium]